MKEEIAIYNKKILPRYACSGGNNFDLAGLAAAAHECNDSKADSLTLGQISSAGPGLNSAIMDEDISSCIPGDKTMALFFVKPFDGSGLFAALVSWHFSASFGWRQWVDGKEQKSFIC